jgi:hypothetical protein
VVEGLIWWYWCCISCHAPMHQPFVLRTLCTCAVLQQETGFMFSLSLLSVQCFCFPGEPWLTHPLKTCQLFGVCCAQCGLQFGPHLWSGWMGAPSPSLPPPDTLTCWGLSLQQPLLRLLCLQLQAHSFPSVLSCTVLCWGVPPLIVPSHCHSTPFQLPG